MNVTTQESGATAESGRELIARAVILRDGKILVNRGGKADGEEYFALPGGHVDGGESCVQALQREIEEELAAQIEVGDLCLVAESIYPHRKKNRAPHHELVLFFRGEIRGALREEGREIWSPEPRKRFCWLPIAEAEASTLHPASLKPLLRDFALPVQTEAAKTPLYAFHDATIST